MSTLPGKVHILGMAHVDGQRAFVLNYLQARRAELVRRPFFARFDPAATWFDELEPLTEHDREYFGEVERPVEVETVPLTVTSRANGANGKSR
jgi:hypothetical protein